MIRQRVPADLDNCVRALRAVHEADGYPVNWPADPGRWLNPPETLAAWVCADPQLGGHVLVSSVSEAARSAATAVSGLGRSPVTPSPGAAGRPLTVPSLGELGRSFAAAASSHGEAGLTVAVAGEAGLTVAVAGEAGLTVAAACEAGRSLAAPGLGEVGRLFVVPSHRGRGVGLRLLAQVREWAAVQGLGLVLEVVDDSRGAAIALYERTGWTYTGTSAADWTGPGGEPVRIRHYSLPSPA